MGERNELDGTRSSEPIRKLAQLRGAGDLGIVTALLGAAVLAALATAGGPIWGLITGAQ